MKRLSLLMLMSLFVLVSCNGGGGDDGDEAAAIPTSTLAPLITLTPPMTATPLSTRTPLPTFTPIPSETPIPPTPSTTPSPTATPPITGIIQSLQTVNIREGPSTNYSAIRALVPGTGVQIIGQNQDGTWINIRMEDDTEGWVSARLLYIEATATPFPTMTPSPDFTALALGTPLPTALIGGGTVTPTPPGSVITATPVDANPEPTEDDGIPTESFLPVINIDSINMTATALAAGAAPVSPPPSRNQGESPNEAATEVTSSELVTLQPQRTATPVPEVTLPPNVTATLVPTLSGDAELKDGVDVFAMCNDSYFGVPAPTNLKAGSSVDVFWAWYVADPSYMEQHLEAVSYEVYINDRLLSNWRQYGSRTIQVGDSYAKYWYVPAGQLDAGDYKITYRATWSEQITDGYGFFGPGTGNLIEEGSCDFTVYP